MKILFMIVTYTYYDNNTVVEIRIRTIVSNKSIGNNILI